MNYDLGGESIEKFGGESLAKPVGGSSQEWFIA
jgi:hypothetical protein